MVPTEYLIVWCDSPLGLISHRVHEDDSPILYTHGDIPPGIAIPDTANEVFKILSRRAGDKVAVSSYDVPLYFGWELE